MLDLASSDGIRLAVHELGGAGRPTLLCHATGFHGAVWEPLASSLGPGLQRWALDFRAHGASLVPPDCPLEWSGFCQDVLDVVDGLGLPAGEVLGVGHSMGGAALVLAEQARPGTFAGLWLFEPIIPPIDSPIATDGVPNPLSETAARRREVFPSAADAIANFASKPPLDVLRADALHAYVRHGFVPQPDGSVRIACRPADEARTFRMAGGHDAFARLGEVECPVVVAGSGDLMGPGAFAEAVAQALPKGRFEQLPALGHFGPLEAPGLVADEIARFAATL